MSPASNTPKPIDESRFCLSPSSSSQTQRIGFFDHFVHPWSKCCIFQVFEKVLGYRRAHQQSSTFIRAFFCPSLDSMAGASKQSVVGSGKSGDAIPECLAKAIFSKQHGASSASGSVKKDAACEKASVDKDVGELEKELAEVKTDWEGKEKSWKAEEEKLKAKISEVEGEKAKVESAASATKTKLDGRIRKLKKDCKDKDEELSTVKQTVKDRDAEIARLNEELAKANDEAADRVELGYNLCYQKFVDVTGKSWNDYAAELEAHFGDVAGKSWNDYAAELEAHFGDGGEPSPGPEAEEGEGRGEGDQSNEAEAEADKTQD